MDNWKTTEILPKNNTNVIIMLKDASGCNAIYKDGKFTSKENEYNIEEVVYWKESKASDNFEEQINKKCLMCGRKRLYG